MYGILYSHEMNTCSRQNPDEFHKHDFEQKKPDTTEYTVCGYIEFKRDNTNLSCHESGEWCPLGSGG